MSRCSTRRYASRDVRVGSTLYGWGVFARRPFDAEEVVGEVRGDVIAGADYWSEYSIVLGRSQSLEPAPPFRFLNHSCEPNCRLICREGWDDVHSTAWRVVSLASLTVIDLDEQLTIDYGWTAATAIPCACGQPTCRGWIIAADELKHLPAATDQP